MSNQRPALELVIHPPAPGHPAPGEAITRMHPKYRPYQKYAAAENALILRHRQKRLTPPELAAEYWKLKGGDQSFKDHPKLRGITRIRHLGYAERKIVRRFLELPHAADSNYA